MDRDVAHGDVGQVAAFVLRPALAAVERDPQSELRAGEEEGRVVRVFLTTWA
jgi:hypothetical protein